MLSLVAISLLATLANGEIVVLGAASLKGAVTEIAMQFEKRNPEARVRLGFSGSQALATQVSLGAPCDVFLSADRRQVDSLIKSSFISRTDARLFATNTLVVMVSNRSSIKVHSLSDLEKPGLQLCLAAPEVPAGLYTRQVLSEAAGELGSVWLSAVKRNIVSRENNVTAVWSRIEMGEADAGIVYATDARRAKNSRIVVFPKRWNVRAEYIGAVTQKSKNEPLAAKFFAYVLSSDGQKILTKYGFGVAR